MMLTLLKNIKNKIKLKIKVKLFAFIMARYPNHIVELIQWNQNGIFFTSLSKKFPQIILRLLESDKEGRVLAEVRSNCPQYNSIPKQVDAYCSPDFNYFAWLMKHKLQDPLSLFFDNKNTSLLPSQIMFSVIIPVYNTKKEWLEKAINSVFCQTYTNWEIVICNDASTSQETINTLECQKERSDKIKIVHNIVNQGISESTNKAVEISSGKYIVLLDHDDELYPDALAVLCNSITKEPDANVFYSDEDRISPQGFRYNHNFKPNFSPSLLETHNCILHLLCINRDAFIRLGGMRKAYDGSQDYDLLLRFMDNKEVFIHVPDILYSWRESETSMVGGGEKPEIFDRGKQALKDYYNRNNENILKVYDKIDDLSGIYRTDFKISKKVSLLIVKLDEKKDFLFDFNEVLSIYDIKLIECNIDESPISKVLPFLNDIDVVIFIDPRLAPDSISVFLNELVSFAMRKEIGVVGCKILSSHNSVIYSGMTLMPNKEIKYDFYDSLNSDDILINRIRDTIGVCGLGMAVKSSVLNLYNNDNYSHIAWDIELCLRAKSYGKRVVYNPYSTLKLYSNDNILHNYSANELNELLNKYSIEKDTYLNPNLVSFSEKFNFSLPKQLPYEEHIQDNDSLYQKWIDYIAPDISKSFDKISNMHFKPFFSIIIPTYNSDLQFFKELVDALKNQTYQFFEVCISDDASKDRTFLEYLKKLKDSDSRFKVVFSNQNGRIAINTNRAIEIAKGDFIVLCDHDDLIETFALEFVAEYINKHPDADVIYSDEDMINEQGFRFAPRLQPDWNPDMLTSHMYCPHLVTIKKELVNEVGLFRSEMDGAQDYDFFLRVTEKAKHVGHVPMILYSWRAAAGSVAMDASEKNYAYEAGRKALEDAIQRRRIDGVALKASGTGLGVYRLKRQVVDCDISHIIECKDQNIVSAIKSIDLISPVPIKIILVIEDGVDTAFLDTLKCKNKVEVVKVPNGSNKSFMYNRGAEYSDSKFLIFSSYNIEILDCDYPLAFIEHVQRDEIGAVGPKIIYPNGKYYHTGMILGVNRICGYAHRNLFQNPGYWNFAQCIRNYSSVSWDLMAVSKRKWEQVKGFDETLKFYNDVDFCLKLMEKGYRNLYTPYISGVLKRGVHFLEELWDDDSGALLLERYKDKILNDPYYHPLLTKQFEDFSIMFLGKKL